ncbi:MAG: hypothetical protein ACLP4V_16185 [Methylocella sp.]
MEIKETGETYQLAWTIGQSGYAGAGFVFESVLFAVFVPPKADRASPSMRWAATTGR